MAEQPLSTPTAVAIQRTQKLEPLHVRIGRLRDQARAETPKTGPAAAREELGPEDAAIRMAAVASTAGKKDAERRDIMRDLRPGVTVTAEGATEGTKTVTTKPSPRFASMDDAELQAVNYNTLTGSDLRAYTDELDRRTPKRSEPANGADPDDVDLDDDDSIQPGQPLPWEGWHPDNNGGNNGSQD
jgi:hypothetical protein